MENRLYYSKVKKPQVLSEWLAYIGDPNDSSCFQLSYLECWHCKYKEKVLHSIKSEYIMCMKCKRLVPTPIFPDEDDI